MPAKGFRSITLSTNEVDKIMRYCRHYNLTPTEMLDLCAKDTADLKRLARKISKVPKEARRYV